MSKTQYNQPLPFENRKMWRTDLSQDLGIGKWIILIILVVLIVTIPFAILLYLFWKRELICTLKVTEHDVSMHQSAGRKINPKVTKYYFNPYAMLTVRGTAEVTKNKKLLIATIAFGIFTAMMLLVSVQDATFFLVITVILGILFLVIQYKNYSILYNLESHGEGGGSKAPNTESGMNTVLFVVLLIVFWPLALYYYYRTAKNKSGVVDPTEIDINMAKIKGLVELSKMSSVVFIGDDRGAYECYQSLSNKTLVYSAQQWMTQPIQPMNIENQLVCPNCGMKNELDSRFCIHCGSVLKT